MSRRATLAGAAAVVAAGLAAYANSFAGQFVFDDPTSIASNATIRHLSRLWTVLRGPRNMITAEGRPLLNVSLALNYAWGGLNVAGYHAVNLAIHLLAGLALFGLVRRTWPLMRRFATAADAALLGAAVAVLWTVHPLQTESVTYIVQRTESMMGLFYLLTLYGLVRGCGATGAVVGAEDAAAGAGGRGARLWLSASVLACALGMLAKEVMVSAPLIALLYDRTFVSGSFRNALRERAGYYAALAATWILLGVVVAWTGGNRNGSIGFGIGIRWWDYLLTQPIALMDYLRLAVWPHPLVIEYGAFWVTHPWSVALPGAVILALVAATFWALRVRPALGFAGFWFFAILAPTTLVPGTTQMIVEHRMYLALAPLLTLLVGAGWVLLRPIPGGRGAWLGGALVLAIAGATLTAARNRDYASVVGLWRKTVALRPGNVLARTLLGQALAGEGRTRAAVRELDAAVRLNPRFAMAQESLGENLARLGDTNGAIAHYRVALAARPGYADAHENLGVALAREGRYGEALEQLHWAIRLDPEFVGAHYNLGVVLTNLGRTAAARAQFEETLRLDPTHAGARRHLDAITRR